ncbi:e9imm peptide [Streptomyces sp. NPDC005752]|uniref:e9imm peptide n=1 Tax=Streptomyces sp. NPDC005752 TaxID=3157065 RepID=UPI003403D514
MRAVELSRAEAIERVQRIMEADYASEDEVNEWLDMLDRALACPSGHIRDLVFWPPERELSAEEVVDHALAYQSIVL